MKKRFDDIDFLRGFAIITIILTHVYGLHLGNAQDFSVWNWLHFVVPGFLFCSGFVLSAAPSSFNSPHAVFHWIGKRITRLLIPYYIYFFMHFLLFLLAPEIFKNFHFQNTPQFIFGSIFFTGNGVGLSWLPILFLELTILFPLISILKKFKLLSYFFLLIIAFLTLVTFGTKGIPLQNLTHWIFWLFPFLLGIYFATLGENVRRSYYLLGTVVGLAIFIALYLLFQASQRSLILTDHKYPPDLFYLSYALGLEFLILYCYRYFKNLPLINNVFFYFSKNSYRTFFLHYVVLDAVFSITHNLAFFANPIIQTAIVIIVTVAILKVWDTIKVHLVARKILLSYK